MARFRWPQEPRGTPVNWRNLESAWRLRSPKSFKEFIDVYGGCVWFDDLSPFSQQGLTIDDAEKFVPKVSAMYDVDRGRTYDENFQEFEASFYPESGPHLIPQFRSDEN